MLNEVSITFEGRYNLLRSDDEKNYEAVERIRSAASRFSQKHRYYNVFGIGRSDEPMKLVEGYEHRSVFREFGIDGHYRVAWVELTANKLAKRSLSRRLLAWSMERGSGCRARVAVRKSPGKS